MNLGAPVGYRMGLHSGKIARWLIIGAAVVAAYFFGLVYPQTATVRLENRSDGNATFYVDGRVACVVQSGQYCTVAVRVFRSHVLFARDWYSSSQMYVTPEVTLQAKNREVYQYLACGQTGAPGTNCGLFSIATAPNTY